MLYFVKNTHINILLKDVKVAYLVVSIL